MKTDPSRAHVPGCAHHNQAGIPVSPGSFLQNSYDSQLAIGLAWRVCPNFHARVRMPGAAKMLPTPTENFRLVDPFCVINDRSSSINQTS